MAGNVRQFTLEDAQIMFRNFAGKEGPFNRAGDRNFALILPPNVAEKLSADGWNVRIREPKENDSEILAEPTHYLPVKISYDNRPPRVVMVAGGRRTPLDESSVEVLDFAEILSVDIVCNPYDWSVNGATGTKAYVKTLYVTIDEDPIERKYAIMDKEADQ